MAMFESLSKRLEGVFTNLSGKGKLTEADVNEAMREVRLALLEADVSLKVVRQFVDQVREKAIGADVLGSFSPAQQVLAIVNEQLRSEEHTSELQSRGHLVCRLLLEKKK